MTEKTLAGDTSPESVCSAPDDITVGDVIAAWEDGTVMLDDSLMIYSPSRARQFIENGGTFSSPNAEMSGQRPAGTLHGIVGKGDSNAD